jgi:hypothetical protein
MVVESIQRSGWEPGGRRKCAWPRGGLSPLPGNGGDNVGGPATAPVKGMDGKPAAEPGSRVQTWVRSVLLSGRERVPGGVCLRVSCPWRVATGAVALWFALGSGPDATEKLNSWRSLYVNFS